MDVPQLSAYDLQHLWDRLQKTPNGTIIPAFHMPPWQEICSDLSWHTNLLDGGVLSEKAFWPLRRLQVGRTRRCR